MSSLRALPHPPGIYGLWALFGHRGRTYYEARSRGLSEIEAAQHTQRILEDPMHATYRTYDATPEGVQEQRGPASAPPPPPRPSQIPVMSQVVPEAAIERDRNHGPATGGKPAKRRCSKFVTVGFLLMLAAFGVVVASQLLGVGVTYRVITPIFGIGSLFLVLGFFHSLFTGKRGAGLAFFGLFFFAGTAFFLRGVDEVPPGSGHDHAFHEFDGKSRVTSPIGRWTGELPSRGWLDEFFVNDARRRWFDRIVSPNRRGLRAARVYSQGRRLILDLPRSAANNDEHLREITYAIGQAMKAALPAVFEASTPWNVPEFAGKVFLDPPPSGH